MAIMTVDFEHTKTKSALTARCKYLAMTLIFATSPTAPWSARIGRERRSASAVAQSDYQT